MNRTFWTRLLLWFAVLVAAQGGTYLVLFLLGIADRDYSNVLINLVFLIACIGLILAFKLTPEDLGLKLLKDRLAWHVTTCLVIFLLYMAFYVFVIRISSLRPFTPQVIWGSVNYVLVAFVEEIYFRGICYHLVESRTSGRAAVLVSALLFGLMHVRQGLGMIARFCSGWLWGTVRYTSGMIFLLIIPIHLAYNLVWLVFLGNWDHPPVWAQFFPLVEFFLGVIIMVVYTWTARPEKIPQKT